jgi:hypothetical protein
VFELQFCVRVARSAARRGEKREFAITGNLAINLATVLHSA